MLCPDCGKETGDIFSDGAELCASCQLKSHTKPEPETVPEPEPVVTEKPEPKNYVNMVKNWFTYNKEREYKHPIPSSIVVIGGHLPKLLLIIFIILAPFNFISESFMYDDERARAFLPGRSAEQVRMLQDAFISAQQSSSVRLTFAIIVPAFLIVIGLTKTSPRPYKRHLNAILLMALYFFSASRFGASYYYFFGEYGELQIISNTFVFGSLLMIFVVIYCFYFKDREKVKQYFNQFKKS